MAIDIVELAEFYASGLGLVTRRVLRRRIRELWPDLHGLDLLGFGFATPFLRPFAEEARRVVALMPASQGVMRWPVEGPSQVALVEDTALPLADASFERVLMVHALEHSEEVRPMLREIWRVLAPEGRLLVIVPHRRSLWASAERTPFGHGHPYSRTQIARLLQNSLFEPARPLDALYLPPLQWRVILRSQGSWEALGARLWPGFGGCILVEATKRVYATTGMKARRRVLQALPVGVPAALKPRVTSGRSPRRQKDWQRSRAR